MDDRETLSVAVEVYRKLHEPQFFRRNVEGFFEDECYEEINRKLESAGLLIRSDPLTKKLEFSVPSRNNAFFAKNLDELIESPDRQLSIPSSFFLAEDDFFFCEGCLNVPDVVKKYFDVSKFANILVELSDYHDKKGNIKAIFLHGEKLEVNLGFKVGDLKELPNLNDFIDTFVDSDLHKEQKVIIIKSVLIEMLKSSEINQLNLSSLIVRFSEFYERVRANYTLYVSEFSFEKIKELVEKEVFEFAIKLNKAFSDIQNQLLAIPVALILAGTQMKPGEQNVWLNISVFTGLIIFSLFVSLLVRNQTNTLNAVRRECDSQWESIKTKHQNVRPLLEKHYSTLKMRYISQRAKLFIVDLILSLSILGAMWVLFFYLQKESEFTAALKVGSIIGTVYLGLDFLLSWVVNKLMKTNRQ
jgi:hypothetical protein